MVGKMLKGIAFLAIFASCESVPPARTEPSPRTPAPAVVTTTPDELARLATYRAATSTLLVDELLRATPGASIRRVDPFTAAYEGVAVMRLLGLLGFSQAEANTFIDALFVGLPLENPIGNPVRNIVVPKWYSNGEPLIIHVTTAYTAADGKMPALVLLFNTASRLRQLGADTIKTMAPGTLYPKFIEQDGRISILASESYVLNLLGTSAVSASGAVGRTLPSFDRIRDSLDRINLADSYLRDGNPANDDAVKPVLETIINNPNEPKLNRTFAYLNTFLYYIVKRDLVGARSTLAALRQSGFLSDPEVANTDLAVVAEKDIPLILGYLSR